MVYLRLIENHLSLVHMDECFFARGCDSPELILPLTLLAKDHGDTNLILPLIGFNQVLECVDVLLITHP